VQITCGTDSPEPVMHAHRRAAMPRHARRQASNHASTVPSARMSQLRARLRDPSRRARSAVEYQLDQLSHAARADKKNSAESKNPVQAAPPVHAWALDKQHTAVRIKCGMMSSAGRRICAADRCPIAQERDQACCGFGSPAYLKLRLVHQQLSHHLIDVVPQPAHRSQTVTW
jgi:hypothetical protein